MAKVLAPTVVATTTPGVTDDASKGYVLGQLWLNSSTASIYVLTDKAIGAAVWSTMGGGGSASDATITFTDITTNNVSTTNHGFTPKAPNDSTKFLNGLGAWAVPAGGGGSSGVGNLIFLSQNFT